LKLSVHIQLLKLKCLILCTLSVGISCQRVDSLKPVTCGPGMQISVLNPDSCECISHAVPEIQGESCECDTFYHWNLDSTACELDSSSAEFDWTVYFLGQGSWGLWDVTIIDENNIWAVGATYHESSEYNLVHWDGTSWEYIPMLAPPYDNFSTIYSIKAFTPENIWAGINVPIHFNGIDWIRSSGPGSWGDGWYFNSYIYCIAPGVDGELFFTGLDGQFVRYHSEIFTYYQANTDINFYHAQYYPKQDALFLVGNDGRHNSAVYKCIQGDCIPIIESQSYVSDPPLNPYGKLYDIAIYGDTLYTIVGRGVIAYDIPTDSLIFPREVFPGLTSSASALFVTHPNDILIVENNGHYVHFDGRVWRNYSQLLLSGNLHQAHVFGCDYRDDILAAVGFEEANGRNFVAIGNKH